MNGLDKIVEHINSRSVAECEEIAESAIIETSRIRDAHVKTEQEEYWKIINAGTEEAKRRLERLSGLAELEAKKQVLAVQQEMLDTLFDRTVDVFLNLPSGDYISFLAKNACKASLTGEEEIILSANDKANIGKQVLAAANSCLKQSGKKAALRLSETTADIKGGLMLSGGDIVADCSLEALVSLHRNALTPFAANQLFS